MQRPDRILLLFTTLGASVGTAILACAPPKCSTQDESLQIDVSGTYDYHGVSATSLLGTITFEQQGSMVRVANTTYANSDDRPLQSDFAALNGNELALTLTPRNGDTNYLANVTFLFGDNGRTFCAEFSDTNGDAGALGTYFGTKK